MGKIFSKWTPRREEPVEIQVTHTISISSKQTLRREEHVEGQPTQNNSTFSKGTSRREEHVEGQLTKNQIARLAASISSINMTTIAEGYLGISSETVQNIERDTKNSEAFNMEVIRYWRNNNPQNQVQELAHLLYEAASKGGYVDPAKVIEILGVSRQEDCGYVNPAKVEQIRMCPNKRRVYLLHRSLQDFLIYVGGVEGYFDLRHLQYASTYITFDAMVGKP